MSDAPTNATAVFVLYRTTTLELDEIPDAMPVVLVHNDCNLSPATVDRPHVTHLFASRNLGFGGGVDLALTGVATPRTIIVNPDAELTSAQWSALADGTTDELLTVALDDGHGSATSVINIYPTPLGHLLSGYRVGRFIPRGTRLRAALSRLAGRYGRRNAESLELRSGRWPLDERWASGAVLSVDTERLRSVGGFDTGYFLYYEDVDLCRRLADRYPAMELVLLDERPASHAVGGSAAPGSEVERHRLTSAVRYASMQDGMAWGITARLLRLRQRWV